MKEIFTMFANYNREANRSFLAVMNKLSGAEREKARGSYYKSLSGLAAHIAGGTCFFLGLLGDAAGGKAAEALVPLKKVKLPPGGKLTDDQWKNLATGVGILDKAFVNFVSALSEDDFMIPVKTDWYKGKPPAVPLYFMISQLVAHGAHHRGQASQILDSLKIDNDWSGINVKFL
jgi:uncharacterized damage-inducible protein DinB